MDISVLLLNKSSMSNNDLIFHQFCQRLGWKGGNGMHDVLPIVMSGPDKIPRFFELPREIVKTIKITHPTLVSLISTNPKKK